MDYPVIAKPDISQLKAHPNLDDYAGARATFQWDSIREELDGLPGGGLNLAYEAVDRHLKTARRTKTAMIWEGKNGEEERYTFEQMAGQSNRFANVLAGLGIQKGDRVFIFAERFPELYFAVFGTLKRGAVIGPLFSAFGPDPVKDRLEDSGAKVLITTPDLRERVKDILPQLPELKHIIIMNKNGRFKDALKPGDLSFEDLMAKASDQFQIEATQETDYSIMHYTSGTTGKPKGAVHCHRAVLGHYATGKWALDLQDQDIYWCTADPGWVTGTSYGISAPWTNGATQLIYEGGFSANRWYSLIDKYKVTVWYTAPTAIRLLMKAGEAAVKRHDVSSLRHICSVGEPLNPEAVVWGTRVFDQAIHDNWWQTETGHILVANYPAMDVRPGSMGRPIPGVEVAIVNVETGAILPPGTDGDLAVKPPWPGMFQMYWRNEAMYNSKFKNGWYITGDRAHMDADGYFWFVGRTDDVINTAGHLVGPFEVESALIEHPAVAEAGVIGKPDPIAMEVVKAFVSLKDGYEPSEPLRQELMRFARQKLAAAVAPREIDFLPSLPKTRSGKIMRRLLKARELGLPEGDTSTLEDD